MKRQHTIKLLSAIAVLLAIIPLRAIGQAQPKVLSELFSNFNCGNCRVPDSTYEAYAALNPGIVLISYHNEITDPKDSFFLASKSSTTQRSGNFYNITADPTAVIDGFGSASSEGTWEGNTTTALQFSLPVITPTMSVDAQGIITVNFTVTGTSGKQVNAYVALKESHIFYHNTEAYGATSGDLWNDIFRTMLPKPTGSDAFALSGSQNFSYTYDPSTHPTWNVQNMTAVVIVQDASPSSPNSYQVEALGVLPLGGAGGVADAHTPTTHLMISGNPVVHQSHIGFELAQPASVRITLCDMLGREVETLAEGMMPSGETSIEMNGGSLPSGCYMARMFVGGQEVDHAKLIVEP